MSRRPSASAKTPRQVSKPIHAHRRAPFARCQPPPPPPPLPPPRKISIEPEHNLASLRINSWAWPNLPNTGIFQTLTFQFYYLKNSVPVHDYQPHEAHESSDSPGSCPVMP